MLKDPEQIEHQHMLGLIGYLGDLHQGGRTEADLNGAEVAALKASIDGVYDRATNAISNLLCYHYGECRSPLTGGDDAAPKSLFAITRPANAPGPEVLLTLFPNPAAAWVTCASTMQGIVENALIRVKDGTGRPVAQVVVTTAHGQSLLDTRDLAKGLYTVELVNAGAVVRMDKLVIQ